MKETLFKDIPPSLSLSHTHTVSTSVLNNTHLQLNLHVKSNEETGGSVELVRLKITSTSKGVRQTCRIRGTRTSNVKVLNLSRFLIVEDSGKDTIINKGCILKSILSKPNISN